MRTEVQFSIDAVILLEKTFRIDVFMNWQEINLLGTDGYTIALFQGFWRKVREDLMVVF